MIQEETGEGIVSYPLDPVRFWRAPDALNENLDVSGGRCLGIQCNIWNRAMHRRHLRHTLRGGGKHHIGYTALKWQAVLQGTCGKLGSYPEIALLPRKTADSSARRLRWPSVELGLDVERSRKRDPDAPSGSDPTPPAGGPDRETPGYALGRRHSQAHLYAKRSSRYGVGQTGRRVGWSRPPVTSPPAGRAGPTRCAAAGRRPGRLGLSPGRPEQA